MKRELPVLLEQSRRLVAVHADRDPRHAEAAATVAALADEMALHTAKEEQILFPLIRQLDRGDASAPHCGTVANPIRVMEQEHEHAGGAVHHLRKLTRGFSPDSSSCETHRTFLAGLARFEQDLHEHVHKENNILFPRALTREAGLMARLHSLPVTHSVGSLGHFSARAHTLTHVKAATTNLWYPSTGQSFRLRPAPRLSPFSRLHRQPTPTRIRCAGRLRRCTPPRLPLATASTSRRPRPTSYSRRFTANCGNWRHPAWPGRPRI